MCIYLEILKLNFNFIITENENKNYLFYASFNIYIIFIVKKTIFILIVEYYK